MPTNEDSRFLEIQKRAQAVYEQYAASASQWRNFLVYGDFGTGKTSMFATAPRPIFIDSFDPGGTKTKALQPLIASGDILIDNSWETDSWKAPFAYREWEKVMAQREKDGFFDYIGTYGLDSITKWADSCMFETLRLGGKNSGPRTGGIPEKKDYLVQQMTTVDWIGRIMALPCHTVMTGHIGLITDEVSGRSETGLLLSGKLSGKVPLAFDEKYITRVEKTPKGIKHQLQTKTDGVYKAETRMGGDLFSMFETPDLRALLLKAGLPADDKPRLFPDSPNSSSEEPKP